MYSWKVSIILLLIELNYLMVQPSTIQLYSIVIDVHVNIPTMKQSGFMFDAKTDGCMPLQPPPSTGHWYVLLDSYNLCTMQKIQHAREAGYQLIISDGENRTITNQVALTGFPIIVTFAAYVNELKKYAVTEHGDTYVTITTEADIHGEQDLRFTVYQDIDTPVPGPPVPGPPAPGPPVRNNHHNGDYFITMSPIINTICFLIIMFAVI